MDARKEAQAANDREQKRESSDVVCSIVKSEPEAVHSSPPRIPLSANKEDSSDSGSSDQFNTSGGESTGVLLTKALNTLVRSEYDMITPPRHGQNKSRASEQSTKKLTLFRPYELDNGMRSEKKCSIPVQSPMLLRSNYQSTGSQWLIEKRCKSEALCSNVDRVEVSVAKTSDNGVKFPESKSSGLVYSSCSDREVTEVVNSIIDKEPTEETAVMMTTTAPTVLHLPRAQPLRSSTPKTSPCPSPNVPLSDIDTSRTVPHHLPSPVPSDQPCDIPPNRATVHRQSSLIPDKSVVEVCQRESNSSHFVKYRTHVPNQVRSLAEEGHRLPLKHSYKHLSYPAQAPERPRSPFTETGSIQIERCRTPVRYDPATIDRFRSNSCPPYSPRTDGVPKAVDLSDPVPPRCQLPTVCSRAQKEIFSSSTKSYLDTVKETWAMHHAMMISTLPGSKPGKPVLPSFSTFSDKSSTRRLASSTSSSDLSHSRPDIDKHSRSKSEGGIQYATTPINAFFEREGKKPSVVPLTGRPKSAQFAAPSTCTKNNEQHLSTQRSAQRTWEVPVADHTVTSRSLAGQTGHETETMRPHRPASRPAPSHSAHIGCGQRQKVPGYAGLTQQETVQNKPYKIEPTKTDKPFNPSVDIYKDPISFKNKYFGPQIKSLPQAQLYDPRLLPRFGTMPPPYLNPLTAQFFNSEMIAPSLQAPITPSAIRSSSSSQTAQPAPGTRSDFRRPPESSSVSQHVPDVPDVRRPLGTSSLQNQSPLPSPVTPEAKMNPLLCMLKV